MSAACATTTYAYHGDYNVSDTMQQPLRDVGWVREEAPERLRRAAEAPYALAPDWRCETLLEELDALDQILGPDLDALDASGEAPVIDAATLMSNAIGGVWSLPYRSVIRWISGAERRDRALRNAVLAGTVRRAFLRGVARAAACEPLPEQTGQTAEAPP
jgi:hypothetical protein